MLYKEQAGMRTQTERKTAPKNIQLQDDDLTLFKALLEFRLMETKHIYSFFNRTTAGEKKYTERRLRKLFHAGFVDRPQRMDRFVQGGGSHDTIHALSNKGRKVLGERFPGDYAGISVRAQNKTLKANFIDHQLFTTEIVMRINEGCRERGDWRMVTRGRFIREMATEAYWERVQQHSNVANGWPVTYQYETSKGAVRDTGSLVPDYMMYIEDTNTGKRLYLMIEADRGTEPNQRYRSKGVMSDVWRKMIMYTFSAKQKLLTHYFGVDASFLVLFVTKTPTRSENMVFTNTSKSIPFRDGKGWKNFLFTTREALNEYGLLRTGWANGRTEEIVHFEDFILR